MMLPVSFPNLFENFPKRLNCLLPIAEPTTCSFSKEESSQIFVKSSSEETQLTMNQLTVLSSLEIVESIEVTSVKNILCGGGGGGGGGGHVLEF